MIILCISSIVIGSEFVPVDLPIPENFTLFLLMAEDILSSFFSFSFSIAHTILLFAISIVFTCLKTHGGIDLSLILQAVKCHPPSSAR
jgi:formate-dependent nitrite reductase membrane component NrfD